MKKYVYVTIDLNNTIVNKRIPNDCVKYEDGFISYESIRQYFKDLGYDVGLYLKID